MTWALSVGRSSFIIAIGILVGAGAAAIGVETATLRAADRADRTLVRNTTVGSAAAAASTPPVAIVDVSRSALDRVGVVDGLIALIGLRPGERIIEVNGHATVEGVRDLDSAWDTAGQGGYLDIEVADPSSAGVGRRVLILIHH